MRKFTFPLIAVASVLALATIGCTSADSAPSAKGRWGSSDETKPHLVLADSGTLNGSDGCNRLVGKWSEKSGNVSFTQVASTAMHCEGADTWLSHLDRAEVDGSKLVILNEQGDRIGELPGPQ